MLQEDCDLKKVSRCWGCEENFSSELTWLILPKSKFLCRIVKHMLPAKIAHIIGFCKSIRSDWKILKCTEKLKIDLTFDIFINMNTATSRRGTLQRLRFTKNIRTTDTPSWPIHVRLNILEEICKLYPIYKTVFREPRLNDLFSISDYYERKRRLQACYTKSLEFSNFAGRPVATGQWYKTLYWFTVTVVAKAWT